MLWLHTQRELKTAAAGGEKYPDTNQSLVGAGDGLAAQEAMRLANLMKYAVIIITTVPIMCMYPFVQKYFSQGVMIGAIKG